MIIVYKLNGLGVVTKGHTNYESLQQFLVLFYIIQVIVF